MSNYVIQTIGGMGNQLFQYAFAYSLAKRNNGEFFLDLTGFKDYKLRNFELNNFNLEYKPAPDELIDKLKVKKLFNKTFIKEKNSKYNKNFLKIKKDAYFRGFWQTERYFKEYESDIKELFKFKNLDFIQNHELLNEIKSSNSISINVRLGDYVNDPTTAAIFHVCTQKYYRNAIEYIKQNVENPRFFVYSDDLEGAKNYLPQDVEYTFCNGASWQEDFYFMQNAKHAIIPNSSFAWWAAYLNPNPNKIILAPKNWFAKGAKQDYTNIVPQNWIKIENF